MKIVRNMFLAVLSLTCSFLGAQTVPVQPVTKYERTILVTRQNVPYVFQDPIDPHHSAMRDIGIFSKSKIRRLDRDTIADLYAEYGVDLSDTNPSVIIDPATGARTLPGVAELTPVVFGNIPGDPWFVSIDTEHHSRENKWIEYQYATLVTFLSNFVVPAGFIKEGAQVRTGYGFFHGYLVLVEPGHDASNKNHHEVFRNQSIQLGLVGLSMWGVPEYLDAFSISNYHNRNGYGVQTSVVINQPYNDPNSPFAETRVVLTWDED